ncbi:MAG: orotate phosphoribosyltransferase [Coriobacteriaceae bacterium]|nr:orotate phosphoribosyltransferase [Coriobacteriaceae bacterium]
MNDEEIRLALEQTKAIRKGHFRLTSGKHSDTYVQCARLMEHPRLTNRLAAEAAHRLPEDLEIDLVISPAVGGILFGFAVATALDRPFIFTERVNGVMVLRRAFEIPFGARVLVAEDVVTTGGSVQEVCELVRQNGAMTVAVIALIDRGGSRVFSDEFFPLLRLEVPSWDADNCGLCKDGIEISAPGSRTIAK